MFNTAEPALSSSPPSNALSSHDRLEHGLLAMWVEAAQIGLCMVDDTGRIVMVNTTACRKFGVDSTGVLHQSVSALLANAKITPDAAKLLSAPDLDGEHRVTVGRFSGVRHLLVQSRSVRLNCGTQYKLLAITDVSQLTLALEESEQYQRWWQATNAGVVVMDARQPDMPITYVNPAFELMTGYSAQESVGRNCRFLQGSDSDQPGIAVLRQAIKNQTNGYAVLRNYRKDGSLFFNELFIAPIKDSQGNVLHFVGVQHVRAKQPTEGKSV